RTPVRMAFIGMFVNIALNILRIRPLHNGGPALATSVSAFFNSISWLVIFHRRHGSFGVRGIVRSIVKFIGSSIALGVVVYVIIHWPGFYAGRMGKKVMSLWSTIGSAVLTYFSTARLMNSRELAELRLMKLTRSEEVNAG